MNMTLSSIDKSSIIKINGGELVSYKKDGEELIHQKGEPGWRNSDTEMFPVIGPTEATDFKVSTPKGDAVQDQHGLLRELEYVVKHSDQYSAIFQKEYKANTKVNNSKYPEKSTKKEVFWPYDFKFKKSFELSNDSLKISFEIEAEEGMPFMLGYHPAFKLSGLNSESCKLKTQEIKLQSILDSGSFAYRVLNTDEITLVKKTGYSIIIKTEGFNNFMLWTEVPNMLCVEPITIYPYTESKELTKNMFKISKGKDVFSVTIIPI